MAAERSAVRASEWEQELDEELPLGLHPESEFASEWETPRLRPLIRSICGEARGIRSRLLAPQARARAIGYARKWLRRTSGRWPYERLRELTRRELDILAGCLYGVASAMGEEPEPYRRLRSDIGRLLRVPAGESASEFEIFPPDERRLVANTLLVPFRFVCCLEIVFVNPANGQTLPERGTGTLISDRHVLTAAHCVFDDISSRNARLARVGLQPFPVRYLRAQTILVAPARNDRLLPFGFSDVATVRVAPAWQAVADRQAASGNTTHLFTDPQADFALLTLATPLGRQESRVTTMQLPPPPLGFWGSPQWGQGTRIRPIELNRLRGQPVNISGYPTDKCRTRPATRSATAAEIAACQGTVPDEPQFREQGSTQWVSTDRVVDPARPDMPGMITYMADMTDGQSGAPVWLNWEGFRNLVAINTGGSERATAPFDITANMGVRITEPVLRVLRAWMRADRVSATF